MASSSLMMVAGTLPMASQPFNLSFSRTETLGIGGLSLSIPPLSISISTTSPPLLATLPSVVYCGRGDRKTAKGKRFNHSFGNARLQNKKKGRGQPRVPIATSPPKKDKFDDDNEIIKIDIDESLFTS